MDRICQYSTIIFAGNVSVLLIVAITTDYWEYRGFRSNLPVLVQKLAKSNSNTTKMKLPVDTTSYFELHYRWTSLNVRRPIIPTPRSKKVTFYQPPAFLHRHYAMRTFTNKIRVFNGTHNETITETKNRLSQSHDILYMFTQYGNLFRECENLEATVRKRLDLLSQRPTRCFNFITSWRDKDDFIARELPAVIHLERAAFTFGVACIVSSIVSVVGGAYGSLMKEKNGMLTASSAALVSGISLTVAIAVFHGKCHLIHRREFMAGIEIPYKKTIEGARVHYYGWSFVLAWICVALSFIHTWVWLVKAQDTPAGRCLSSDTVKRQRNYDYQDQASIMAVEQQA